VDPVLDFTEALCTDIAYTYETEIPCKKQDEMYKIIHSYINMTDDF